MPPRHRAVFSALIALVLAVPALAVPILPTHFDDQLVAGNLDSPTNAAFLPDGRMLVTEQYTGRVRVVVPSTPEANPPTIGTIDSVRAAGEAGLVGIAVDPAWPAKPYIYVQANRLNPNRLVIWRYRVTGDLTNTTSGVISLVKSSRYTVLSIPDNSDKHNGGTLRFGLDGRLFSGIGDDDNACSAQDLTAPTGKILRLEVSGIPDGPGGPARYSTLTPPDNPFVARADTTARLVWAYGLRNPFAFEVDKVTGCLIVGDVGNESWEEVDRLCVGGRNLGWPMIEGPQRNPISCTSADTTNLVLPIYTYPHDNPGWAVVGGPAYHAPPGAVSAYPASYEGTLFLGDTWRGLIRHLVPAGPGWAQSLPIPGQPDPDNWETGASWITHLEVGPDGALWYTILYQDDPVPGPGEVRRILYYAPSVDAQAIADDGLRLAAPSPSPTRGPVALAWTLARPARVALTLVDVEGRIVRRIVRPDDRLTPAGPGRASWDGRDESGRAAPPGLYFARLTALGTTKTARIVRL